MSLRVSASAHHVAECEIRTDASWIPKASAPRQVIHFTPTSAARLNMVERFFREITDERIRRDNSMSGLSLKEDPDVIRLTRPQQHHPIAVWLKC
jgi:hypothetical protein